MAKSFNFTIEAINKLPFPTKGITSYRDTQNPALSIYVTSFGSKTFFVRKRIYGRDSRLRIGAFPTVKIEQARKQAMILAAEVELGQDPLEEKRKKAERGITVKEQCALYIEQHCKLHNKNWHVQEREMAYYFKPIWNKIFKDLTRDEVNRLHLEIGKRTKYQANRAIGLLRAVFNHAIRNGYEGRNPAVGFRAYKEQSRDRFILPEEMPFLLESIKQEESQTAKDFFWMLLMTGSRKTNMQEMRWEQIDWHFRHWRIPNTKNGQPLILPLIDQAFETLEKRRDNKNFGWVFPQEEDLKKCIRNPQKAWERIRARATLFYWNRDKKLEELINTVRQSYPAFYNYSEDMLLTKVKEKIKMLRMEQPPGMDDLRIHDLRRTFGSYQALSGASLPVIGRSLGHKSLQSTQIYARLNLDPVRASIQTATNLMLQPNISAPLR